MGINGMRGQGLKPNRYWKIIEKVNHNTFLLKDYSELMFMDTISIMYGDNHIQTGIILNHPYDFLEKGIIIASYLKVGWSEQIDNKSVLILK